jgi:hypothetical protein
VGPEAIVLAVVTVFRLETFPELFPESFGELGLAGKLVVRRLLEVVEIGRFLEVRHLPAAALRLGIGGQTQRQGQQTDRDAANDIPQHVSLLAAKQRWKVFGGFAILASSLSCSRRSAGMTKKPVGCFDRIRSAECGIGRHLDLSAPQGWKPLFGERSFRFE